MAFTNERLRRGAKNRCEACHYRRLFQAAQIWQNTDRTNILHWSYGVWCIGKVNRLHLISVFTAPST